ncbi:MAG: PAS domain-containing protein, partial [Chitinophagaceae bacterium]
HFLILFNDTVNNKQKAIAKELPGHAVIKNEQEIRIQQLEKDLMHAREDMRSITDEQETINEELQSSNEELLSGSEELQSLNEEMETSKEELQSTNEELITVNQEIFDRNEQLNLAKLYAEAIVDTIHEPLLVLSSDFKVKSASKSFFKTFRLIEEDTLGNVLFELEDNGWNIPGLRSQLLKIQRHHEKFLEWEAAYKFPHAGKRTICFKAQPVQRENGENWILLAMEDITQRKEAEISLAESESFNRTVLENSPDCVKILDGEGRVQFINSNGCIIMDIEDFSEVKNKYWWELWGKKNRPMIKDAVEKALNGKKTQFQAFNPTVKGVPKWWDVIVSPLKDTGNSKDPKRIISVSRDITQQKNQAIKEKELLNRFQNLLMNAPVAIAILKGKKHIVELANDFYLQLVEKDKDFIGKSIFESLPAIKAKGIKDLLDGVMQTGNPYGNELEVYMERNNKTKHGIFNFTYQPVKENDNTISGIIVIATEVTDLVLSRRRIEESEKRFHQLADLMPEKITNMDAEGNIHYFNKIWVDYTGMSVEELKNGGWENSIHAEEVDEEKKNWQHSIATGNDFEFELRLLNKEGEYRWHLSRAVAIKNDEGKIKMWIGAITDIHDQKSKEEAKDEFISIASHELKTPLTTAKAYIHLLQLGMEKTKNKDLIYVQKASSSIDRLNDLISELLDVSKITNGKLGLQVTTFNFNEMISSAIESVEYATSTHSITRSGEIDEPVTGDKERLQQVAINLLSNAVKYSPKSNKVMLNMVQENGEVKVSVKDSGIGILKENLGKIFERYYREEDRAVHFQGLGIGLYISYEIIQRHNGKLWAESKPGKGSTFYFTVPI